MSCDVEKGAVLARGSAQMHIAMHGQKSTGISQSSMLPCIQERWPRQLSWEHEATYHFAWPGPTQVPKRVDARAWCAYRAPHNARE